MLCTILVEDSKTIRDTLVPALAELANVSVVATAETASEAVRALQIHKDDCQLVIVDLFLKAGSGLEVLRACRQRSSKQRVVVLSNYAPPDMRRRCMELGADAVFDKSTELEKFFDYCKLD